jgi:hypothetical protein
MPDHFGFSGRCYYTPPLTPIVGYHEHVEALQVLRS